MLRNARWESPVCDIETREPCTDEDCEGLDILDAEEDLEECFLCDKVDCICDELTDRYKERDLFE